MPVKDKHLHTEAKREKVILEDRLIKQTVIKRNNNKNKRLDKFDSEGRKAQESLVQDEEEKNDLNMAKACSYPIFSENLKISFSM